MPDSAHLSFVLLSFVTAVLVSGPPLPGAEEASAPAGPPSWSLAIQGGAGVIPKDMEAEKQQAYFDALRQALALGRDALARGESSLDVVEKVVGYLEDVPLFNAGKGAVFTAAGTHELDAAIMDGRTLGCGAVSGLTTVKNPISLARHVMERTRHVFLLGEGAETFATEMEVERVEPDYFSVPYRYEQWQKAKAREAAEQEDDVDDKKGTVGAVARDQAGNLAAATSTGGLTNKRFGRVGDVPVIGAGTYANNATAAISATGIGEQFIRHTVAHDISALIEYRGLSLQEAAEAVIHHKLEEGDGGIIGVGADGSIALVFNSPGMFRGAADANGRFEVKIWE